MKHAIRKMLGIFIMTMIVIILVCGCTHYKMITISTEWTVYEKQYIPPTSGTSGHWGWNGGLMYVSGAGDTDAHFVFFLKRTDEEGNVKVREEEVNSTDYMTYEVGDPYITHDKVQVPIDEELKGAE